MKLAPVFALAVLFVICAAEDFLKLDDSLDDQWEDFKILHYKKYDGDELERRMIWEKNLQFIRSHNFEADMQIHNYHLGMNHLGDMTRKEINSLMLYRHQAHKDKKHDDNKHQGKHCIYYEALKNVSIAKDVDWRESGHVTGVKDQGYTSAGWAFAAVGAIEGVLFRKRQQLIDLSEQQLIDCSSHVPRHPDKFPTIHKAMEYVQAHGIQTKETYPYKGITDDCTYNKSLAAVKTGHCMTVERNAENILKYLVAVEGPTSVAIDASQSTFHFYRHGIYDDKKCNSTHHNHGALIVGYSEDNWLLKNSWGPSWGYNGYMEIARDSDNQCGIASSVVYPQM